MMKLIQGDCLEVMKSIGDNSVDAVICDPPYGTTACKWDNIILFEPMWEQLHRVCKDNGAIVLFGSEPFSSALRMSNIKNYKYDWVWEKNSAKGHFNAKKRPMVAHELIHIFYKKQPEYNPQKTDGHIRKSATKDKNLNSEVYNKNTKTVSYDSTERYPRSVLKFGQDTQKTSLHPTQKPITLMEYLIKTYTNEGGTVLDFTMGSGSTGVACQNLKRNFIGIEKDEKYFKVAKERIDGETTTERKSRRKRIKR